MPSRFYLAVIILFLLLHVPVRAADSSGTHLFRAPDESAEPIGSLKRGEELSPMAETVGVGGVRWYLVRTKSGVVGWIKGGGSEESKKLERFFDSIPYEVGTGRAVELPKPPSGPLPSGTITVPVQKSGESVIVSVTLNQSLRTYLILDTGATTTMVSRRIASKLALRTAGYTSGRGIGGTIKAPVARLRSLKVGKAEVQNLLVTIHDFQPNPEIGGLLGLDFLGKFHVSLDSRKKLLVLSPR